MEEPTNNPSSEIELSGSWTVVNSDDSEEDVVNAEIGETSDSESLEVLEVEHADMERNFNDDDQEEGDFELERDENSCEEDCTIKDCNDSFVFDDPIIHIATVQKVKKYVHHPSAYINMWLSIVMVIAIAVTLGLGIGHYMGSKRFARAKDVIHHLQYENQMLEQELADVVMKNKFCENDLQNRGNVYSSSMPDREDDVCYAEDNPFNARMFNNHLLNETKPSFLQWITYVKLDGEQYPTHQIEDVFTPNRSYVDTEYGKGDDLFDTHSSFPKLGETSDKTVSTKKHLIFFNLNTRLTYLHSLLKKWQDFHENLKLQVSSNKAEPQMGLQGTVDFHEVAHKISHPVSGSSDSENVKLTAAVSYKGLCRPKVKQCILHKEKFKDKAKKCRALPKAEILCSLLLRSKKRPGKVFLDKKNLENKSRKSESPKPAFKENKNKKNEAKKFTYKKDKENSDHKIKFPKRKDTQRGSKDNVKVSKLYRYRDIFDRKKEAKKEKMEDVAFEKNKEKHYKGKYFAKNQNRKEKENYHTKEHNEKQSFNHIQHLKKKHSKAIKKEHKQSQEYDFKEFSKNKDKKHITNKHKREYSDKFKNPEYKIRNTNKNCRKYHENGLCQFPEHFGRFAKDQRCSAHSKFSCLEHSHAYKTKNSSKNDSENACFKHPSNMHLKDKNFLKCWKERNKFYRFSLQEIKVLKS